MHKNFKHGAWALPVCAMAALAGCGSGSSSTAGGSDSGMYTVGGTVSGLSTNESVALLNEGGGALIVTGNGGFTFSAGQAGGSAYDVTVNSHTPGLSCSVSNGSGAVGSTNVTSVAISCSAGKETVLYSFAGGTADGALPESSLIMDSAANLYGTTLGGGLDNRGTVFKLSSTGTESVLHSFIIGTTDGQGPWAGLIMDSAGNLYGTTESGGVGDDGTVFKISAAGVETILYSFMGGTADGQQPQGGLIMDSAGNLYGTTSAGGAKAQGTVFKISPTGTESVLYSFKGNPTDGDGPLGSLVMDGAGNLYGTTNLGGADGEGTVFGISATGTESFLYSFEGYSIDGQQPSAGLITDGAGNLYGTTTGGGAIDDGTVFKISSAGTEAILHSFTSGTTDGQYPLSTLVADSDGSLYGTTGGGGANNNGTVFKISASATESILHFFAGGPTDGQDPGAGLIIDSAGNLYGTTQKGGANGDGTVFEFN